MWWVSKYHSIGAGQNNDSIKNVFGQWQKDIKILRVFFFTSGIWLIFTPFCTDGIMIIDYKNTCGP